MVFFIQTNDAQNIAQTDDDCAVGELAHPTKAHG
jgi:hypothetical protein